VSVDHGSLQTGVAQELLDHPDVVIGLEEMGGEGVAEGVGSHSFRDHCSENCSGKRLLEFRFMEVITPEFTGVHDGSQRPLREEPLMDQFFWRFGILTFYGVIQEHSRVPCFQVFAMQSFHYLQLLL